MNKPFFWPKNSGVSQKVKQVHKEGCLACGLDKSCKSPHMEPTGGGKKGMLVLAEAPGKTEDETGIQLKGEAGQTFRSVLFEFDIDLDRDCRKTNALSCRPFITDKGRERNRPPTDKEITYCRPRVWKEIDEFKPKVILLLGTPALESFLGHRYPEALGGISRWRGIAIPDRDTQAWVVPTVHPSYVNRSERQPVVKAIFKRDIKLAVDCLERKFPKFEDEQKQVRILKDADAVFEVVHHLLDLDHQVHQEDGLLAFDFETSGIKPHADGHFIRCMSMCWRDEMSISFIMPPEGSSALRLIKRILGLPRIRKTAHNLKFEDTWAREKLGAQVKGWHLCTMIGAHMLDNRRAIAGLDFQAYTRFGAIDYVNFKSSMKQWLEAKEKKNANAFNRVQEAPENELLLYCGLDSLFQYRLARLQEKELGLV